MLNSNIRGFYSKKETLTAILNKENIDICVLTETHTQGNSFPQVPGFRTYFRNRKNRQKGGVAILLREYMSKYVTKIAEGEEENEYFCLKVTNTNPNLVIIA